MACCASKARRRRCSLLVSSTCGSSPTHTSSSGKFPDPYLKLGHIYERVGSIIEGYLPDCMAIEAPFFGKNIQSMLKLGRAQGVAIAAAIQRQVPITEYAPSKIKMAITGNGNASKEQVADMLRRMLHVDKEEMGKFLDASDALGVAYCHFMQQGKPETDHKYRGWADFVQKNKERVKKRPPLTPP